MNKEDPFRQIADDTRQKIQRGQTDEKAATAKEIPPRSEVHHKKREKAKTKKKISYPLLRLLSLFFILLPIIIIAVYSYQDVIFPAGNKQAITEKTGYEMISIEDNDTKEKEKGSEDDVKTAFGNEKASDDTADISIDPSSQPTQINEGKSVPDSVEANSTPPQESTEAGTVKSTSGMAESSSSNETSPGNKNIVVKEHTVQPKETLYRIAINYYHSKNGIDIIKKANNLSSNEISVGQVLKIPIEN